MSREPILVWDWPVRLGHWLLALAFVVCWLTSESERLQLIHVGAGAVVVAIASFRLIWGLIGTRHARFAAFVRSPVAIKNYLGSVLRQQPEHHTGHNPAGGWAIIALLSLGLLTSLSGWAIFNDLGGHWLEELHEGLASSMLAVVGVHLAGVVSASWLHRENLVRAMLTGKKLGEIDEAIPSARPLAALVLLAWIAFMVWTLIQP
ncbi:MAG: cytochrome b/b6 domain-containing protein [Rhodocyclales bacterium]|nr:cytochrome b/b6 domain-containing protein [Rhodocyclales bacterium]